MKMDTALMDVIGKLKAQVDEVMKVGLPKADAEERFKKIETGFDEMQAKLAEERNRKDLDPSGDVDSAGSWLVENGCKSLSDCSNMRLYETDEATEQTVKTLLVPTEVQSAFKVMDEVLIVNELMGISTSRGKQWEEKKDRMGQKEAFCETFPELGARHDSVLKVLTTGGAATGAEWIPETFTSQLLDIIRVQNPVVNLVPHVNQPANPWTFPILDPVGIAFRKLENSNIPESTPGTANKVWTAFVCAVYHSFSDEMDEDSIVAVAPQVRASIIRAMAEGFEEAMISGDNNSAGHIDDDYQTGSAPFRYYQGGFNGLRQFALDAQGTGTVSKLDGAAASIGFQMIGDALAQMGKFGAGRLGTGDIVTLTNTQGWLQLLSEAGSPVVTVDKYGSQATILSGELGRIFGVPVMTSFGVEQRKDSVASTGMNDPTGNTFSTALIFNRMNFKVGDRRNFRFETDRNIIAGRNDVVATSRWSLNAVEGDVADANWDPQATPAVVAITNID